MQGIIAARPPGFHVNLGDLPTWLGVAAASVAAVFVYLQLRTQQRQIARQATALERQQANEVDLIVSYGNAILFIIALPGVAMPGDSQLVLVVKNRSKRPIRQVTCGVQPDRYATLHPTLIGIAEEHLEADRRHDFTVGNPAPGLRASLVAAGELRAFVFDCDFAYLLAYMTEFTDDAGLAWRIDQNLHLQQLKPPAAGWHSRLMPGTRKSLGERDSEAD